ncbi:MAG: hypothetical protein AABY22_31905 [Nanoarchaeota archaeon]
MSEIQVNYLQVLGGHCFICHKDWEKSEHICKGQPSLCSPECSKRYTGSFPFISEKHQYNFCPHCGREL